MTDARQISKKTLLTVSVAHALALLLVVLLAGGRNQPPKMLEMIGLPENLDPAVGEPSALQRAPEPATTQPPAAPVQPPPSAPPPVAPPTPVTPPQPPPVTPPEPPPPVKPVLPADPAPVKPPPPKPRIPVKPNLDPTVRSNAPKPADGQRTATSSSSVNPRDIERSLNNSVSGNPNAGVRGGNPAGVSGSPGSPLGNKNGDWYRTLIKNTLERHWMKPPLTNPALTVTIKIRVLSDGTIEFLGITTPSGDAAMDNSVINAVRAAGKISTPPPAGFKIPYEDAVVFKFKND